MPSSLARRPAALAGIVALVSLAACRGDQLVSSASTECAGVAATSSCSGGMPSSAASPVIEALDDAVARLLPPIADEQTRADLAAALGALRVELLAGRQPQARVQLALAYAAIERGEGTPSAPSIDVADLAAVRLSLVPVAEALGVRVP